ncbi:MAG TPA: terminase family protein [Streptosporangiaceae bacterium]|nr:terminase family protein [Streptosporangiaceae bacterium]
MVRAARRLSEADLRACLADPVVFAERVLGVEPWRHQVEVLRARARIKVLKKGRRAGGTAAIGFKALHVAFSRPDSQSLIVSAREDQAKRIIEEAAVLAARSDLFADCVVVEQKSELRFANGSRVTAVPATQAAIRGLGVDFLALDEAFQIADAIWRAAEPATADRPDPEIWLCSTPGNAPTHFFNVYYRRGVDEPSARVRSWLWPSALSPRMSKRELKHLEQEAPHPWHFRREYLAEDVDDSEAVFPDSVIFGAVAYGAVAMGPDEAARYRIPTPVWDGDPVVVPSRSVAVGIDPGGSRDPHAVAAVGPVEDHGANGRQVYAVVHLETIGPGAPIEALTARVLQLGRCYDTQVVIPEQSGLGYHWARGLHDRFASAGITGWVIPLATSAESKLITIGQMAGMLAEGTLVIPEHLPRFADLVGQMRAIGQADLPGGGVRLAARHGHDDLLMAVALAMAGIEPRQVETGGLVFGPDYEHTVTGSGAVVPLDCQPVADCHTGWRDPRRLRAAA